MSSERSVASDKRRADSSAPSAGGEATTAGLYDVVAVMKAQLESLQHWKLSAEERLRQLESKNELLGERCGRLEGEKDAALSQLSATSVAVESIESRHDELKQDEQLYEQGHERPEGDFCPICTLPIPLPTSKHSALDVCCMTRVCNGCVFAAKLKGVGDTCAFCRTPTPEDSASELAMAQKRVDAGDVVAMDFLAYSYYHGRLGLEKDVQRALELWTEAVELGSLSAHFELGRSYYEGDGVEQDIVRAIGHWECAAMKGGVYSRNALGIVEYNEGNYRRATKHYLISAKMGFKTSLDKIRNMFTSGDATKEQYAEALKGYGDAVEETKSYQREFAIRMQSQR